MPLMFTPAALPACLPALRARARPLPPTPPRLHSPPSPPPPRRLQGKSTLLNTLVGEERCLTGPEPGLTRDAIRVRVAWEGQPVELVDTAGWIRRARLAAHDDSGEQGWV